MVLGNCLCLLLGWLIPEIFFCGGLTLCLCLCSLAVLQGLRGPDLQWAWAPGLCARDVALHTKDCW